MLRVAGAGTSFPDSRTCRCTRAGKRRRGARYRAARQVVLDAYSDSAVAAVRAGLARQCTRLVRTLADFRGSVIRAASGERVWTTSRTCSDERQHAKRLV